MPCVGSVLSSRDAPCGWYMREGCCKPMTCCPVLCYSATQLRRLRLGRPARASDGDRWPLGTAYSPCVASSLGPGAIQAVLGLLSTAPPWRATTPQPCVLVSQAPGSLATPRTIPGASRSFRLSARRLGPSDEKTAASGGDRALWYLGGLLELRSDGRFLWRLDSLGSSSSI